MNKYIITILGSDRPGIIARVTDSLYRHDCNIENANQMIMQKEFAGFFIAEPAEDMDGDTLKAKLQADLEGTGLHVHINRIDAGGSASNGNCADGEAFLITTIGPDQKGLVARISGVIAAFNANITSLKAVFKGGDTPDDNIMVYEVCITPDIDRNRLFDVLKKKAETLDLDIRIQHKNIFNTINKI